MSTSRAYVASRMKVPNAQFLNDVACATDGTVYVSDMAASRIVAGKVMQVFAKGEVRGCSEIRPPLRVS